MIFCLAFVWNGFFLTLLWSSLYEEVHCRFTLLSLTVIFQGDLGSYLQKKGRLSLPKALRFALDIARHVQFSSNKLLYSQWISPDSAQLIINFLSSLFLRASTKLFDGVPFEHLVFWVSLFSHCDVFAWFHVNRGMNYLQGCKPDPIIHCDLKPK